MSKKGKKIEVADKDPRFEKLVFSGTFRDYQQRVINNSAVHLKDKSIHIVAAPGSGKTILGLELIRILGKPALILSPTVAIREQWKERLADMYVPKGENVNDFMSCTLKKPKLMTSITYQGLYTSWRRLVDNTAKPKNNDDDTEEEMENFSGINIIELMEEHKISVLCLDEAHHLRAEWQKALYEFVAQVQHNVTVIALTATPPYDSKKAEWEKYIAMCGPIDEEIFVPELVRAKNLCPHQDFIYYNFPTEEEMGIIEKYQKTVEETLQEIFAERKFLEIITNSEWYKDPEEFADELGDRGDFVKSLLAFLQKSQVNPPKFFLKSLERDNRDIVWDLVSAEILFSSMMKDDVLFSAADRDCVKSFLSKNGLVEKGQLGLVTTGALETLLFSSIGKLRSISAIASEEYKNLGEKIKLLILTDFIRVNSNVLGSDREIKELGVIPIFEMLRRQNIGLKLAIISGKIVIVPNPSLDGINEVAKKENVRYKAVPINGTEHSELKFDGTNSAEKISVITKAFNAGVINGIVGTKSLLGEGWDSPVINTLILASCVGSFMLSNQMRGRAIRIDKNVPEKVSNIWHLTAILPDHLTPDVKGGVPPSMDYATLERRFHSFMGICFSKDVIESTMQRVNTLSEPYTEENVKQANAKTFEVAKDRDATKESWGKALEKASDEVLIQNEIPEPKRGFIPALIIKPTHYSTVKKVTNATIKTFKDLRIINKKAKAKVEKDYVGERVNVGLMRCSQIEKSNFHQAMSEVLGAIDDPRYILVKDKGRKLDYRASFSVPEIFAGKKEHAEVFRLRMNKRIADFKAIYTRSDEGKKHLTLAKKKAYVNKGNNEIQTKMKLRAK